MKMIMPQRGMSHAQDHASRSCRPSMLFDIWSDCCRTLLYQPTEGTGNMLYRRPEEPPSKVVTGAAGLTLWPAVSMLLDAANMH